MAVSVPLPKQLNMHHALVLFSGGQDSTTCLAWALSRFDHVDMVGFDYGQRHKIELEARSRIIAQIRSDYPDWSAKLGTDHLLPLPAIAEIGGTAMTEMREITFAETGLPTTFVPARNLLFFTYAAALAYRLDCGVLVGGMCETDYSGYPDCRYDALQSQQETLRLGMAADITIETPLMWLDKTATWQLAEELGGDRFVHLVTEHSHTCYVGERGARHPWGYGCGECPACELRATGWASYTNKKSV